MTIVGLFGLTPLVEVLLLDAVALLENAVGLYWFGWTDDAGIDLFGAADTE